MEIFICKFCLQESKKQNKNSLVNHERCCPSNPDRKYRNGMAGKKGSNQFSKAKKLGLPIPKGIITKGMLGKTMPKESRLKISNTLKQKFDSGELYSRGRSKFYKENPDKQCMLYLAVFEYENIRFIKIGITEYDFVHRYSSSIYNIFEKNLLIEITLPGLKAVEAERKILNRFKKTHYFNPKTICDKFVGHTECLNYDVLDDVMYEVNTMVVGSSPTGAAIE